MEHVERRDEVEALLSEGFTLEEIAEKLFIPIGTRFEKGSVKWYRYCLAAKENQKKAIEKDPNLYSRDGRVAQQKHPWLSKELGKKYGPIQGKKNAERLKGNSEYFSNMAKKLHKINPCHSRDNMRKAHQTMRDKGNYYEHQRNAALRCMEKNPDQLKRMSKIAHEKYPLALLALESKRKNYPYRFMNCSFDSNEERVLCEKFVDMGLIENPIEGVNIHFRIGRFHVDFFIKNKIFVEYHPPRKFGRVIETEESYFLERRKLLDDNGFEDYPLVVINSLGEAENKLKNVEKIIQTLQS